MSSASANSDHSSQAQNRRTGKVARLPTDLRRLVNLMLADGVPYPAIIRKLAEHGHQLTPNNLSRWHAGGFKDWAQEQAWLEQLRARLDFAAEVLQQNNGPLLDAASLRIALTRMYTLLIDFDPASLSAKITEQPGAYARILNVLCKLVDGSLKLERHHLEHDSTAVRPPVPSSPSPPLPVSDRLSPNTPESRPIPANTAPK